MAIDSGVPVASVRVPAAGLRHQVRAATVVWQREMIRFGRDRSRIISSLIQPVLFLFVLGTGLSSLMSTGDVDFRTFLFPGVLAMSVLFTAAFSGISIVWDRTRNASKIWCGMYAGADGRACGSIAKVRRYRARRARTTL